MLAAITCFYNPTNSELRLNNYRIFREAMIRERQITGIPLYTIELAFGDQPFQLNRQDADHLTQIRASAEDTMWQKERLLNILIEDLPSQFDKVVWIDCDLIFASERWSIRTANALDQYAIIQPYSWALGLPQCKNSEVFPAHWIIYDCFGAGNLRKSFSYYHSERRTYPDFNGGHVGYVWAAKRELLHQCKLYDVIVTGAGDLFMTIALYGMFASLDRMPYLHNLSDEAIEHFFEWGYKFCTTSRKLGGAGFTPEMLMHLWHGDVSNRNYLMYSQCLGLCHFSPNEDLELGPDRLYHWKRKNYWLHESVNTIFKNTTAK